MKSPPTDKPNPFSVLLADVERDVTDRLRRSLAESQKQASGRGTEVRELVRAVSALTLRGGKRLRATLCVVGGLSVSKRAPEPALLQAGVALELLQSYFLIHDDWMDGDALRRGGPTAHVSLAARLGSSFLGDRAAILAGDHAVALAQLELARVAVAAGRKAAALRRFAEMQLDAVAGQQRDLVGQSPNAELTYFLKTASYTVTGPLLLGAELSGGRPKAMEALAEFAAPAGIAFQLRDDLIGAFGDPRTTGKPRGADLLAGKSTPLLRHGRRLLTGPKRRKLEAIVGKGRAPSGDVEAVLALLEQSGAKTLIERRIERLRTEAEKRLRTSAITVRGRELLAGALERMLVRHA
jgi:geranylgeranyl diphosphate synthase type I